MVSLASLGGGMAPPPKPLSTPTPTPKRPTLATKRDSSYLDTDDESNLSVSTKKLRVAFDPNVDIRIVEDWTEKSFDLVKEEVTQGIERHVAAGDRRDDTQYLKLLQVLGKDPSSGDAESSKLLKKYVLAIDSKVNLLGECGKLVIAVLDLSWLGRDDAFVAIFTKFLCDLASAYSKFIPTVMERLVPYFAKLPASVGRLPGEMTVTRVRMFSRLHTVIKALLRQVPSASSALIRSLRSEFPNDLATTKSYLQYQKHVLELSDAVPELKAEILALLVQRLVNIDVQIQQDIEDLEDEAEDKLLHRTNSRGVSGNAEDSDDSDIDSMSESEETITEEEERLRDLQLKVSKMDGTLDLLFEYYSSRIQSGSDPNWNEDFQQLLSHFETLIRPNRTRHAQFLIFHFAQLSQKHVQKLVSRCLRDMLHKSAEANVRLSACAYLASFIARGAHLPAQYIREQVSILAEHLDEMRQRYEPYCQGPDRRSYRLYYAMAQALLYIFCFRWRELIVGTSDTDSDELNIDDAIAERRDLHFLPGLKEIIRNNVYSRLNPLKICSPEVVTEFAEISNHLQLLFVFPLLETNKRLRLTQNVPSFGTGASSDIGRRETAWDRKLGEAHHHLEAYFPFDPYTLPKSKHWVDGDYKAWKPPPGMRRKDDGDQSESEDEMESGEESVVDEVEYLPTANVVAAH